MQGPGERTNMNKTFEQWLAEQPDRIRYPSIQLIEKAWYDGRMELTQDYIDRIKVEIEEIKARKNS
jgi:hypothetical protein